MEVKIMTFRSKFLPTADFCVIWMYDGLHINVLQKERPPEK